MKRNKLNQQDQPKVFILVQEDWDDMKILRVVSSLKLAMELGKKHMEFQGHKNLFVLECPLDSPHQFEWDRFGYKRHEVTL